MKFHCIILKKRSNNSFVNLYLIGKLSSEYVFQQTLSAELDPNG